MIAHVYHNMARDGSGRPLGMLDGYAPEHPVLHVADLPIGALEGVEALEYVYFVFNVGDDRDFGTPKPEALAYRFRGNRSLSVGDVVEINSIWYAVGSVSWHALDAAPRATTESAPGSAALETDDES